MGKQSDFVSRLSAVSLLSSWNSAIDTMLALQTHFFPLSLSLSSKILFGLRNIEPH